MKPKNLKVGQRWNIVGNYNTDFTYFIVEAKTKDDFRVRWDTGGDLDIVGDGSFGYDYVRDEVSEVISILKDYDEAN
jgi:hypothetical protein